MIGFAACRKRAAPDGTQHATGHNTHTADSDQSAEQPKPVADWKILVDDNHHDADSDDKHAPHHPGEHAAHDCLLGLGPVEFCLSGCRRAGVLCDKLADSFEAHAAGSTELLIGGGGLSAVWTVHSLKPYFTQRRKDKTQRRKDGRKIDKEISF